MVEDLGVVGAFGQSVEPHADRPVAAPAVQVEVGHSVSQNARLGTELEQRLAQRDALAVPAHTHSEALHRPRCHRAQTDLTFDFTAVHKPDTMTSHERTNMVHSALTSQVTSRHHTCSSGQVRCGSLTVWRA